MGESEKANEVQPFRLVAEHRFPGLVTGAESKSTAATLPCGLSLEQRRPERGDDSNSKPSDVRGAERPSIQKVIGAFHGTIQRQPASLAYRAGLLGVALLMVLLPCIYAGLTLFAGWWVVHYTTHILPGLLAMSRGLVIMAAFISPAVVGSVIALFMLKPLLAPAGRRMHPIRLVPQSEPRLYAFIQKLCEVVGAPLPGRIEVDCNVNASASLRGSLRGFLAGDMTLTIGLPLVAGLTIREFAGVLAHEFGHFTQGSAMRVAYLVRSVNAWFYRVVYERDQLDDWLAGTMFTRFAPLVFVAVVANIGVWFSRLILKALMYLGHAASSFLLRQMEYDADRYEVLVVGNDGQESIIRQLAILTRTATILEQDVFAGWQANLYLPKDFPAQFLQRLKGLTPEQRAKFEAEALEAKPSWADSHPTDAQRIAAGKKVGGSGVFELEGPATALFDYFVELSHPVSRAHYEDDLDLLVPADFAENEAGVIA